jgi:hypothetical protein
MKYLVDIEGSFEVDATSETAAQDIVMTVLNSLVEEENTSFLADFEVLATNEID